MIEQIFNSKTGKCFAAILIPFSFSFIVSCNDNNPTTPVVATSALSIILSSPDAPNVDIYLGNSLIASNISYMQYLSYLSLPAGINEIELVAAGTSTILVDTTYNYQENGFYSMFVIDSLSNIKSLILPDDLSAPPSNSSKIRFLNLSPNGPDMDLKSESDSLAWYSNYPFPEASSFNSVAAGTYNIDLEISGSQIILDSLDNMNLANGGIYTFIASGFDGASGQQALGLSSITNYPF
jgi:Domain of unknown function (DUF4397)